MSIFDAIRKKRADLRQATIRKARNQAEVDKLLLEETKRLRAEEAERAKLRAAVRAEENSLRRERIERAIPNPLKKAVAYAKEKKKQNASGKNTNPFYAGNYGQSSIPGLNAKSPITTTDKSEKPKPKKKVTTYY